MSNNITEENIWKVFETYYKNNSIVSSQLDSYNDFINFGLQEIIDQESTITMPNYIVKFGHISLAEPQVIEEDRTLKKIFPMEARKRDLNYDSAIYCDISETYIDGEIKEEKIHNRIVIGRMPVMLRSCICNLTKLSLDEQIEEGECPNDPGGYFIIKGNERVLVGQMRANYNHVFVLQQKHGEKYKYIAETRSMSTETGHSVLLQAMFGVDDRTIVFSLPYIKEHIPVGVVFKALGYTNEQDIIHLIGLDNEKSRKYLRYILRDSFFCQTKEEALKYIGKFALHIIQKDKEESYASQVVESELLPHLGVSASVLEIACFLGHMVRKLITTVIGVRGEDDRDNYSNKRVEVAGALLYDIFRNLFKKYIQFIVLQLEKKKQRPDILSIISRTKNITKGIHQCMATGNWGVQKNASYVRTGVSQVLDRLTYCATLSHLRRVLIPIGKEGKNTAIRQIHPSQYGFICPCETPEGHKVGVVLNFSLLSKVTKKTPIVIIRRIIEDCKTITLLKDIDLKYIKNYSSVFLNNIIIGFTQDPDSTLEEVRNLRKIGIIDNEVSVSYDIVDNDLKIFCDEGRFIRPLFTLTNNKLNIQPQEKYKWKSLIKKGLIQYVDCSEIENSVIAMTPEMLKVQYNDYCEIHPCTMLGIMASMIPFADHSQSPRNCYQSSMGKQALGIPILSYNLRADTILHVLHYPQRPLVCTKPAEIFGINDMPSGINAIVAIACYSGFNQEDSVMLNFSAVQRGMFCLTSYHTIDCFEKKRDTYSFEEIRMPPPSSEHNIKEGHKEYFKRKNANYSLLDDNGIIRTRTLKGEAVIVKKGDVIIGKVVNTGNKNGEETKVDASVVIDTGEEGVIDKVISTITPNGYKLVKVVIRVYRSPTLGDKLASRSAQKGTIGMMYRQEDMPFTSSGIVPDIIINPCCIPSRMTINQLIECALGKECTITGNYADATPFTQNSVNIADKIVERANSNIEKYGFQSQGWETMYNGMTGEMMEAKIFIGPTYYQRLKHMVVDKMHARAKGHVTMLTRQPLEGRAKDGGLRFGEMERDAMISHGTTRFLKERLFDVSDPFQISLCKKCGIATNNTKECQSCKGNDIKYCNLAYASKLLTQELTALGLKVSMFPDDN